MSAFEKILSAPLRDNDAGAATVGEYLANLLIRLWQQEDAFSGKHPFGNSGWKFEVYGGLIEAGLISGDLDEDGDVNDLPARSQDAADLGVCLAIKSLLQGGQEVDDE